MQVTSSCLALSKQSLGTAEVAECHPDGMLKELDLDSLGPAFF